MSSDVTPASPKGKQPSDAVQATKPAFVFIHESGASSSSANRRANRSQVKKTVAERIKKSRPFRFIEVTPAHIKRDEDNSSESDKSNAAGNEYHYQFEIVPELPKPNSALVVPNQQSQLILFPDLPKTGYEKAKIEFDLDLSMLSGLTSVHLGKGTTLKSENEEFGSFLLNCQRNSYLDLVPRYYSSSALLRAVVNCTMARYTREIHPTAAISEATVLRLYSKALVLLQSALGNPNRCLMPDVLLATAILQVYEILSNESCDNWSHHTLGLARLLDMRDPTKFDEVDKSVISCSLGSIMMEFNQRQIDSYLEQPKWKRVLQVMFGPNTHLLHIFYIWDKFPRFLRVAKEHILFDKDDPEERSGTLVELREVEGEIYQLQEQFEERALTEPSFQHLLEVPWSCRVQLYHIIMALDPLGDDAIALEEQSNELTEKILAQAQDWTVCVELAHWAKVTREDWMRAVQGWDGYVNANKGIVAPKVWSTWYESLLRKAPTVKWSYWKS